MKAVRPHMYLSESGRISRHITKLLFLITTNRNLKYITNVYVKIKEYGRERQYVFDATRHHYRMVRVRHLSHDDCLVQWFALWTTMPTVADFTRSKSCKHEYWDISIIKVMFLQYEH